MAIEEKLDALTAALNRNSDLLEILTAKAKSSISADAPKSDSKADAPKATKPADEPKAEGSKRGRPAKAKVPTPDEMATKTKEFLDVEAEDEYNARRDLVKSLIAKYGVKKMSEIAEEHRQAALDALDAHKRGEPVDGEEEEEDYA